MNANKPVFAVEYNGGCGNLKSLRINGVLKGMDLGTRVTDCTTGKMVFS